MTLLEINAGFSTDEKCRELLERLRWPEGVTCPRCKDRRVSRMKDYARFECVGCEYQFTVMSGTIFHDSHLPLPVWFLAVLLICEAKKGMSASQLKRTIWGLNKGSYKTAWYLCHRIRAAMASAEKTMLYGTVEMDETYVGGVQRGHQDKPGHGESTKQIVIGLRQRGGETRFFHAEDAKSGTLAQYIKDNVSEDVDVVVTDEYTAYPSAMKATGHAAKHKTIKHKAKVYVDGDIHTNTVESAFSLLKRGVIGTWHQISAKHLGAYLQEMEFRFNRRGRSDLFVDTLRHMVTADPLTFEELTA
ncbi:MAG TPA: IS1595 family transposase [Acidobacteriaceae bacterium]|jgi:transposase-like protein|nr:IS1595 family transposase [Acidobacteriaceae bacterium]